MQCSIVRLVNFCIVHLMITLAALLNILVLAFAGIGIFRLVRMIRSPSSKARRVDDATSQFMWDAFPRRGLGDQIAPRGPHDPIDGNHLDG